MLSVSVAGGSILRIGTVSLLVLEGRGGLVGNTLGSSMGFAISNMTTAGTTTSGTSGLDGGASLSVVVTLTLRGLGFGDLLSGETGCEWSVSSTVAGGSGCVVVEGGAGLVGGTGRGMLGGGGMLRSGLFTFWTLARGGGLLPGGRGGFLRGAESFDAFLNCGFQLDLEVFFEALFL